jgi:ABC-type transporter Mla maintaining outer membrane lipid asymmetry permease subunit MlaE
VKGPGLVDCDFGLHTHGRTEGVGPAATRNLVLSMFAMLLAEVGLLEVSQLLV